MFLMTHDACLGSRENGEGVNVCLRVMHFSSLLVCAKACNHKEKNILKEIVCTAAWVVMECRYTLPPGGQ